MFSTSLNIHYSYLYLKLLPTLEPIFLNKKTDYQSASLLLLDKNEIFSAITSSL